MVPHEACLVDQYDADVSWLHELRRRVEHIRSGEGQLLDYEESHARLRAELAARHQ